MCVDSISAATRGRAPLFGPRWVVRSVQNQLENFMILGKITASWWHRTGAGNSQTFLDRGIGK